MRLVSSADAGGWTM